MIQSKIQIDLAKVTNLHLISYQDKIIISEQIDIENKIKTLLWLERTSFKGKDRISLNGAAYMITSLNNEFVMQKTDVLGYHQINKDGQETITHSIYPYNVKSLYELIIH
jgi:hypothetical protein